MGVTSGLWTASACLSTAVVSTDRGTSAWGRQSRALFRLHVVAVGAVDIIASALRPARDRIWSCPAYRPHGVLG
jgi:hypothetical protein